MNTKIAIQAAALLVAAGLGVVVGTLMRSDNTEALALAKRARDFCGAVHEGIELDARDLARGDDPARQRVAADRFMSFATYHSEPEILMCSLAPPDLSARDACWIKYDYPCLEKVARAAARGTKQPR